ncbi:MAG: penicillin acylase family protein [Acidobacteriota bacterium]
MGRRCYLCLIVVLATAIFSTAPIVGSGELSSGLASGVHGQLPALGQGGTKTVRLRDLSRPVEIIKDRWGISHIYADSEEDLFFAQGYNAARDRLFQLEVWRRQASGTVAEILGRRELKRDIGTRLFRFRGDLEQEMAHYHPRGKAIITSFVNGINAYVEETEQHPDLLPIEFELLGIKPGRWTPEVVISRHQGLLGNIVRELNIGRAVARLGPEKVKKLSNLHPGEPEIALDEAIDPELLFDDILGLYNAFRRSITFRPEDLVTSHRGSEEALLRLASAATALAGPRWQQQQEIGSNNWVVSGRLTLSGHAMMANDPHRAQAVPSLRYWVHLVGPGWNVIGGGEPEIPGVSIGHNEYGAWGLTVFGTDGEDLYVYDTNPENSLQYRYRGQWLPMQVIEESIPVKGEATVSVELKYTRHGPVVWEDRQHHKAYAVRAAWREVGGSPYLASLRMDQARNWQEFRQACSYSNIPGENMVWADVHGDIGWQAVGIAPIRRNWSGLVPVPGDGRYEWDGYLPIKAKPHLHNPDKGFWATANNDLIPPDYPYRDAVGWSWSDPYRAARIEEVLGSGRKLSMMEMMRLQTDYLSIPARTLVPLLEGLTAADARVEKARQMLLDWDYVLDKDSVTAGIYVAWERRLQDNVGDRFIPAEGRQLIRGISMSRIIAWLIAPPGGFGPDPIAGRDRLLLASLEEAVRDLMERLGPQMSGWRYGQERYKHVLLHHPLSGAVDEELRRKLEVGPLPRGGNSYTVGNTGGGNNQTAGASFRIIADTGSWDSSVGMNNPGQSGDPDSPHYDDLFELWAKDKFFPVFFTRARIEKVAESVTVLVPAAGSTAASAVGSISRP